MEDSALDDLRQRVAKLEAQQDMDDLRQRVAELEEQQDDESDDESGCFGLFLVFLLLLLGAACGAVLFWWLFTD